MSNAELYHKYQIQINNFDINEYLIDLQDFHAGFYALAHIFQINFIKTQTIQVRYEKSIKKFILEINPEFFFTKTRTEQIFLLCHETMHIVLQHFETSIKSNYTYQVQNIGMDIVINEFLVDSYFSRPDLTNLTDICFVNTIFSPQEIKDNYIITNGSWDYYCFYLQKLGKTNSLLDCISSNSQISSAELSELLENYTSTLSQDEIQDFNQLCNSLKGGTEQGGHLGRILLKRKMRYKWNTILDKALKTVDSKHRAAQSYSFERISRRNSLISNTDFLIPNLLDDVSNREFKHKICFFLDTSGSCARASELFYNFAHSLPREDSIVEFYTFDTRVYPVNINKNRFRGGGGTSFYILEKYIQTQLKYPDVVFVCTDGYGDEVYPAKPERWHWFLTQQSITDYIDSKSKIHYLSNFIVK